MRFFVAVTDNDWFDYLSQIMPDELNFWRPSGRDFSAVEVGSPLLFKLRRPWNHIAGGGFFVKALQLPVSLAWDAFGEKNGAPDYGTLLSLIQSHRRSSERDPEIGCIILNEPFFIPREEWIAIPEDWSEPGLPVCYW